MQLRLIVALAVVLCGAAAPSIASASADEDPKLNTPGYGWKFSDDPPILEGDWVDGGSRRVRAGRFNIEFHEEVCQRRSTLRREDTWMLVCEKGDPTYGRQLWGIYMRPWEGDRWQFAKSRPAPNLEALSSGNPDEQFWYTYTKSPVPVAGPSPTVAVTAPPASQPTAPAPPPPPPPQTVNVDDFRVDNTIPQPPPGPRVWWYTLHRGLERVEAGKTADDKPLYLCRVSDRDGFLYGHVRGALGSRCVVTENGAAKARAPFDFLLERPGAPPIALGPMTDDPERNALMMRIAYRDVGPPLCVVSHEGAQLPGQLLPGGGGCSAGLDREEIIQKSGYFVIVKPPPSAPAGR